MRSREAEVVLDERGGEAEITAVDVVEEGRESEEYGDAGEDRKQRGLILGRSADLGYLAHEAEARTLMKFPAVCMGLERLYAMRRAYANRSHTCGAGPAGDGQETATG